MNKFDVLSDLDLVIDDENAKNVASWIAALSDGEYLSKFNYTEDAVNDAVDALERLNDRVDFIITEDNGAVLACVTGFDNLVKTLTDYMEQDESRGDDIRYNIRGVVQYRGNVLITCAEPARGALHDLGVYQLICILDF